MKPVLQTERLKLVPFDLSDAALLHQTLTEPFVRKYLMDDEIIAYEKAEEFIAINEQCFKEKAWGLWKLIVKEGNRYAGLAGLWVFFGENQPQLLCALLPDNVKKGYATEASKAVVNYAFSILRFGYLVAAFDTPNEDSRKLCERLGLKETEEKEINGNKTTFYRLDNGNVAETDT